MQHLSGSRVGLFVDRLHPLNRNMCVYLRRRKTRVPEQSLDAPQIRSVVEQVCCEAMAQLVRTHVHRNIGKRVVFAKHIRDRPRRESLF